MVIIIIIRTVLIKNRAHLCDEYSAYKNPNSLRKYVMGEVQWKGSLLLLNVIYKNFFTQSVLIFSHSNGVSIFYE